MAADSTKDGTAVAGAGGCACEDCPTGAKDGHRRAVAAFVARREELAAGHGVPAGLAHSTGASRQWVSDELTQSAKAVAERGRLDGELRLRRVSGAFLAPLVGEDNRLSTSRAVAAVWVLLTVAALLVLAIARVVSDAPVASDGLARGVALATVLALTSLTAVAVRWAVAARVRTQRLQKGRALRPRVTDLLCDDAGRGSFTDCQYVLVTAAAAVYTAVLLVREPRQVPEVPWAVTALVVVSVATYLAGKVTEGGRPVILSIVRAREPGDLDGPVRTGDDIEIRGCGFVPPGARSAERLGRIVVRIGAVHVHVPLVPVPGGFANPTDTTLTVPVPAEVEPGRASVQVVTASGAATNHFPIDVLD